MALSHSTLNTYSCRSMPTLRSITNQRWTGDKPLTMFVATLCSMKNIVMMTTSSKSHMTRLLLPISYACSRAASPRSVIMTSLSFTPLLPMSVQIGIHLMKPSGLHVSKHSPMQHQYSSPSGQSSGAHYCTLTQSTRANSW